MKKLLRRLVQKINRLPRFVRIESCSLCNLNCRDCYMRKHVYDDNPPVIGNGYLKFENYKKFIDENPYIESVELSFAGEMFLNPDLLKIIQYSASCGIELTALNGVNFNEVSEEMLEALVKYKFAALALSIDGASKETYSIYRTGGNYDKVMENVRKLNCLKEKYKSVFPILTWQYIMFKHNINEIRNAAFLAQRLNFARIYYKRPWNRETNMQERIINFYNDKLTAEILHKNNINLCMQTVKSPQINWDGRLLGCCCSTYNDLGVNVFETSFKKALNSSKLKFMHSALQGKKLPDNTIACGTCAIYAAMKNSGRFIKLK